MPLSRRLATERVRNEALHQRSRPGWSTQHASFTLSTGGHAAGHTVPSTRATGRESPLALNQGRGERAGIAHIARRKRDPETYRLVFEGLPSAANQGVAN